MLKCDEHLQKLEISKIKICVYQHNEIARKLYYSLGFKEKFHPDRGQYFLEKNIGSF
jgi:ribosomal protein S18 acetylase RimI-like enzyme